MSSSSGRSGRGLRWPTVRRTNRIHETDLVRALDLLLRTPEPPALVHAVDRAPAPLGDVMTFSPTASVCRYRPTTAVRRAASSTTARSCVRSRDLAYPTYEDGYTEMIDRS
ncbi:hypothetical protein AB1285_21165 [Microbacterium sp. NRRL B-14842]|uniref:hypothetical protein n=1 Tax=Microbacterium sp. NRRL B-14842 TaxID=3162881 RepID=UPI003D2E806F